MFEDANFKLNIKMLEKYIQLGTGNQPWKCTRAQLKPGPAIPTFVHLPNESTKNPAKP